MSVLNHRRHVPCLIGLALGLSACGTVAGFKNMFGGRLVIEVEVVEGANLDNPVAMDLLIVSKKKLLDELLETSAREWFSKARGQFLRDHPKGYTLESREWVPGQQATLEIPLRPGAADGVLFADYFTEGSHRMRIDPREPIHLRLDKDRFEVEPLRSPRGTAP